MDMYRHMLAMCHMCICVYCVARLCRHCACVRMPDCSHPYVFIHIYVWLCVCTYLSHDCMPVMLCVLVVCMFIMFTNDVYRISLEPLSSPATCVAALLQPGVCSTDFRPYLQAEILRKRCCAVWLVVVQIAEIGSSWLGLPLTMRTVRSMPASRAAFVAHIPFKKMVSLLSQTLATLTEPP